MRVKPLHTNTPPQIPKTSRALGERVRKVKNPDVKKERRILSDSVAGPCARPFLFHHFALSLAKKTT